MIKGAFDNQTEKNDDHDKTYVDEMDNYHQQ